MKYLVVLLSLFSTLPLWAQTASIKVIATQIAPGQGSKIHIASYKVLKVLEGQLEAEHIQVGYYFYTDTIPHPDTVLLHLEPYTEKTSIKDYYIFPKYNAAEGIKTVQLSYVSFKHWEACETGQGPCPLLTFSRDLNADYWYLWMPCGGTSTNVTLKPKHQKEPVQNITLTADECPPVFDLTHLSDGTYTAYMLACGLGGPVDIQLTTPTK